MSAGKSGPSKIGTWMRPNIDLKSTCTIALECIKLLTYNSSTDELQRHSFGVDSFVPIVKLLKVGPQQEVCPQPSMQACLRGFVHPAFYPQGGIRLHRIGLCRTCLRIRASTKGQAGRPSSSTGSVACTAGPSQGRVHLQGQTGGRAQAPRGCRAAAGDTPWPRPQSRPL